MFTRVLMIFWSCVPLILLLSFSLQDRISKCWGVDSPMNLLKYPLSSDMKDFKDPHRHIGL
ncbi:hypothetical protein DL93DRAFT_2085575 [Clavulina sp. PMI_390]|nr:hypothetical protein DL93DRAFT_2085575 [Clavulina sp. PMI_390]